MTMTTDDLSRPHRAARWGAALALATALGTPAALADEADAKRILRSMTEFMGGAERMSFDYDATLEVVTTEGQKLALSSSGSAALARPDKIRATRAGGFADIELIFDGKTLTLHGKTANRYTQVEIPGSIDNLIDELQNTYHRPMPGADLLLTDAYDELMDGVTDIKDLGSGVVGGQECDFFAFRTEDVDWQIWIAHGDRPYPCQYIITTKEVEGLPQYTFRVRNFRTGAEAATGEFTFANASGAEKIEIEEIRGMMSDLPDHFRIGAKK